MTKPVTDDELFTVNQTVTVTMSPERYKRLNGALETLAAFYAARGEISSVVRPLRKILGLTQQDLADRLSIPLAHVAAFDRADPTAVPFSSVIIMASWVSRTIGDVVDDLPGDDDPLDLGTSDLADLNPDDEPF